MTRTPRLLAISAALLILVGCATTSVSVSEGSRVIVRLFDGKHDLALSLANASHPDLADLYSTERDDATLKLSPDVDMAQLLGDLHGLGFDDLAEPGLPPSSQRGWIWVERDGSSTTLSVPAAGADQELLDAFARMKEAVSARYAETGALQFIANPDGARLFEGAR